MEFISKIELQGIVGAVRTIHVGGEYVTRFSLMTEYAYKDLGGVPVVDTTWHSCVVWSSKCPSSTELAKGNIVRVLGRPRCYRYTTPGGDNVTSFEVAVSKLEIKEA